MHRPVGSSLVASLEPLVHHPNAASLTLLYMYYFGSYSSKLAELVPFTYSEGLLVIQIDYLILLLPFLDFTKIPSC